MNDMFSYVKHDLEDLLVKIGHIVYEDETSPLSDDFLRCVKAYQTKNIDLANIMIAKHRRSGLLPKMITLAENAGVSFEIK